MFQGSYFQSYRISTTSSFHHIPIRDTSLLTEVFRRGVIKLFVTKKLLDRGFATKFLSWKHSGFSVDNYLQNEVQRILEREHKIIQGD